MSDTNSNNTHTDKWYIELIKALPLKKQTRAQAANHLFDSMAVVLGIAFIATDPPAYYSFTLVLILLLLMFSCIMLTKPKR